MAIDRGLLAILEAKARKGEELEALLQQARELAAAEEGTVTWYAFRLGERRMASSTPSPRRTPARHT